MSGSIKETFNWRLKALDKTGRIDHVFATLRDPDLERQFQAWHWQDRRRTGLSVLILLAATVAAFIAGDILIHGWTPATMVSTAARAPILLIVGIWIWLNRRNRPSTLIDITTFALAASIGACLTIELLVRGIPWEDLAMPALVAVVLFILFLRQPLKFTLLGLAALLVPFTGALIVKGADIVDLAHAALLLFGCGLGVYYLRLISIATREFFLQNNQLEQLAAELDENMKTMALEHQAVQRAAEENAALADDLALSRMEAEENAYYLENILENIAQGVVVVDRDKRITKFNSTYVKLAGVPEHLAKPGTHLADIVKNAIERGLYVDEETLNNAKAALDRPDGMQIKEPIVIERAQGNGRYVEVRRNPLPDGGEVSTYTDITERKRAEEIVRAQALRDPLTDLSNRHHYTTRLDEAIARSRRSGSYVALVFLDLDLFKPVNDTHGHAVGDAVLREVAATLRAHVREVDTVARLGGDEFAIIFDDIKALEDVRNPLERILHALTTPLAITGATIRIGVSAGIAFYPLDGETAEALAKAADRALYEAKEGGRGCYKLSRTEYEVGLPKPSGGAIEATVH